MDCDDLLENEHDCTGFEANPFKAGKCKACGSPWTQHKGVIDEAILLGFLDERRKASEQKQWKEEQERKEAQAKRAATQLQNRAVEDEWLCDGAPAAGGSHSEGSDLEDNDAGFKMFDAGELQDARRGSVKHLVDAGRREALHRVTNLIDFAECDVPEEEPSPTARTILGAAPDSPTLTLEGEDLSDQQPPQLGEMEYLRQRLAVANEEKNLEIEVLRESLDAEQAKSRLLGEEVLRLQAALADAQEQLQASQIGAGIAEASFGGVDASARCTVTQPTTAEPSQPEDGVDASARCTDAQPSRAEASQPEDSSLATTCAQSDAHQQEVAQGAARGACTSVEDIDLESNASGDEMSAARSWNAQPAEMSARCSLAEPVGSASSLSQRDVPEDSIDLVSEHEQEQCSPFAPVMDVEAFQQRAERCLQVCHTLSAAAGMVVQSLSSCGSALQRVMSKTLCEAGCDIASLADHEDPLVQHVVRLLLASLRSVSVSLVDLAAGLCAELQQPLEDFCRSKTTQLGSKQLDLECLRQRRRACTGTIMTSLQSNQMLAAHQAQMSEQTGLQALVRWFSSKTVDPVVSDEEIRLMQRREARTVEEMREQILALMHTEQVDTTALGEEYDRVEGAMREVLQGTFLQFPRAWAKSTDAMRQELWDLLDSS